LISYIRKFKADDDEINENDTATIQAYADAMILVANSEESLQLQLNRTKNFFDFANIKLNPNKCQVMSINSSKFEKGIKINEVIKEYIAKDSCIKYLGIPLGSRKIGKSKFFKNWTK
jgi:hypothetical protein